MQTHHRREGLGGRHRRPGPGALRRGAGGGAEAVRGPQACVGDATRRLRALNGHYWPPFSILATALDVSITLGGTAGATYTHPHYHRPHCHGLPQSLVLPHRHRQICPYAFDFGLKVVPRVCWGQPQCTCRSYSVQHA